MGKRVVGFERVRAHLDAGSRVIRERQRQHGRRSARTTLALENLAYGVDVQHVAREHGHGVPGSIRLERVLMLLGKKGRKGTKRTARPTQHRASPKRARRGRPAERSDEDAELKAHVAELVAAGRVKPGRAGPPLKEILRPGPRARSASEAVRWARGDA